MDCPPQVTPENIILSCVQCEAAIFDMVTADGAPRWRRGLEVICHGGDAEQAAPLEAWLG